MSSSELLSLILPGIKESLYMTFVATFFAYLIGMPMGIALIVTEKNGLRPNRIIFSILDFIVNITRSIPFLILLVAIQPFTSFIVGTSVGSTATIVPLVVASAPFVARLVESSLLEIDPGIIEAGRSMGTSNMQIITKILIPEAKPSLINGCSMALITILSYSAMAGFVGGGGLGTIAINYGFYRYQYNVLVIIIILLIVLVQFMQGSGNYLTKRSDKRKTR